MNGERRAPARVRATQHQSFGRYVTRHVLPYSQFYRPRLDAAGVRKGTSGAEVLARLPLTTLDEVEDPATLVLRPEERAIQRYGDPALLLKVFWAKAFKRAEHVNRTLLEPVYKPLHWHVDAGIPMGYSAEDLDRLADLGRRVLAQAELGRYDVVLNLLPAGPNLPYWQMVLGARRAGVSAIHLSALPTPAQIEAVQPAAIIGRPADVERALGSVIHERRRLEGLHTIIATGEPLDERQRERLRALAGSPEVEVVGAWAPAGVRSLWAECRRGEAYHTFPDVELVEVVDPTTGGAVRPGVEGEIVWSGIGWKGSALLRLRTGLYGSVEDQACLVCGRTSPRVRLAAREPRFVSILDRAPGVSGWQAELRTVDGVEELVVFLSLDDERHAPELLQALDRDLSVTQFVVLDRGALAARLRAHGDQRVLDRRLARVS